MHNDFLDRNTKFVFLFSGAFEIFIFINTSDKNVWYAYRILP